MTLRQAVTADVEAHFHRKLPCERNSHSRAYRKADDTGCAVANAWCAFEAGASYFSTTVLGIGERVGITSLGGLMQCVIGLGRSDIVKKYKVEKLGYVEDLVARAAAVEIPFDNFDPITFTKTLNANYENLPQESTL
jgi:homocitrate synthase